MPNLKVVAPAGGHGRSRALPAVPGARCTPPKVRTRTLPAVGFGRARPTAAPTRPASAARRRTRRRSSSSRSPAATTSNTAGSEHARVSVGPTARSCTTAARSSSGTPPPATASSTACSSSSTCAASCPGRFPPAGARRRTGWRPSRPRPSPPARTASPRPATTPSGPPARRSMRPRATRRRARSTAAPLAGRAARHRTSRCWRTRSPTRRSPRPPGEVRLTPGGCTRLDRVLVVERSPNRRRDLPGHRRPLRRNPEQQAPPLDPGARRQHTRGNLRTRHAAVGDDGRRRQRLRRHLVQRRRADRHRPEPSGSPPGRSATTRDFRRPVSRCAPRPAPVARWASTSASSSRWSAPR